MSEAQEDVYPCVGICIPDADEAYCLGCGRPWGEPRPAAKPDEALPAPKSDESPPA